MDCVHQREEQIKRSGTSQTITRPLLLFPSVARCRRCAAAAAAARWTSALHSTETSTRRSGGRLKTTPLISRGRFARSRSRPKGHLSSFAAARSPAPLVQRRIITSSGLIHETLALRVTTRTRSMTLLRLLMLQLPPHRCSPLSIILIETSSEIISFSS